MLTTRQKTILNLLVDDYIATATPVASDAIHRNHNPGVSPATIRKEIAELEDQGYLIRPHSSAGCVPLDSAYRFYVESLVAIELERISERDRSLIRQRLSDAERDPDDWASVAAAVLSSLVGNMAVATFPKAIESRVRHLELVRMQDLLAMLIVVLEQATLKRQLIRLKEPVAPEELETSVNRVRKQVLGLTRRDIESNAMDLNLLEEEVVDATVLILREEERASHRDHYVDGLRNLLSQPEFSEYEKTRAIVEGLEDGSLIHAVLEEAPEGDVVRVTIGQEHRGDMLWPLSVVICQYGVPDRAVGALGAVGPTRMEYSKAIAGVRFMSSVMSDMVEAVDAG